MEMALDMSKETASRHHDHRTSNAPHSSASRGVCSILHQQSLDECSVDVVQGFTLALQSQSHEQVCPPISALPTEAALGKTIKLWKLNLATPDPRPSVLLKVIDPWGPGL